MNEQIIILEEYVETTWNYYTKNHYLNLGYNFTKIGDKFTVKVCDLPKESTVLVTGVCPSCNLSRSMKIRNINRVNHTFCNKCMKRINNDKRKENYCCNYCGEKSKVYRFVNGERYCNRHARQMMNRGYCYKSICEKNDIILEEDHAKIVLRNKRGNIVGYGLIDFDDIDKIKPYKWRHYKGKTTEYVYGSKDGVGYHKLHRVIMNPPDDLVVDHRNHNGLDNRKQNLKVCTQKENMQNLRNKSNEGGNES